MGIVSDAEVEAFQKDGAIVLRDVFSKEWLDKVERGIAACRENPGEKFSQVVKSPGEKGGEYFNDKCQWQNIPDLKDFALNSPAGEIAGRLMKSQVGVVLPRSNFINLSWQVMEFNKAREGRVITEVDKVPRDTMRILV